MTFSELVIEIACIFVTVLFLFRRPGSYNAKFAIGRIYIYIVLKPSCIVKECRDRKKTSYAVFKTAILSDINVVFGIYYTRHISQLLFISSRLRKAVPSLRIAEKISITRK